MLQTINGFDLLLVLIIAALGFMLSVRNQQIADLQVEYNLILHPQAECCDLPDYFVMSEWVDQCHNCGSYMEHN